MYSPRIAPALVKRLYKLKESRKKKIPLTQLVHIAIIQFLEKEENKNQSSNS